MVLVIKGPSRALQEAIRVLEIIKFSRPDNGGYQTIGVRGLSDRELLGPIRQHLEKQFHTAVGECRDTGGVCLLVYGQQYKRFLWLWEYTTKTDCSDVGRVVEAIKAYSQYKEPISIIEGYIEGYTVRVKA